MKSKFCFWQDKVVNKDYTLSLLQTTANVMETIAIVVLAIIVNVMA